VELVTIGDAALLESRARTLGITLALDPFDPAATPTSDSTGRLRCCHIPLAHPVNAGTLDPRNAAHVVRMLETAGQGALQGLFDAVVTGPVHKGVINESGIAFTGHTEFFATQAESDVLMLLVADDLRVALATTHLPLAEVPRAITPELVERCLLLLERGLVQRFGIAQPRIAVLGLNPHAGENGHLGREEIERIAPTVEKLRAQGLQLDGPLSADTAFVPERRARFDAYLAMFHDQGLPVLKALGFGGGVNVTLGLPYIRTSVDHGTALELAGTGRADPASLVTAVELAIELCDRDAGPT
jgi:4-hydroxythreonine-4-phosphate dehydrogenase